MRYLLHSGGLDSHVAWLLDPDRVPVYVCHDARNQHRELAALADLADNDPSFAPLIIDGLSVGHGATLDGHVRHRNLVLLVTVAAHLHANEVVYAAVRGEASADKSPEFVRALDRTLRISEGTRLVAPLLRWTKGQAVRAALDAAHDRDKAVEALLLTRSCYSAEAPECGQCQACYRRHLALWQAGMQDTPPDHLPTETDGAWANLRRTPLRRWPDLARANTVAVRAWLASRR